MVFSSELALRINWPKYWSFSFSINEYSGLISFRIDWFDLLAVQGTLKSLSNSTFESINSSALSLLYGPNPSSVHDYQKTIALTMHTFVGKLMSLLFNALSRFIIAFLPRWKHLLISWLKAPYKVILEPMKVKSVTASTFPPIYLPWSDGNDAMIFVFWILTFKPDFSPSSFSFIKRFFSSSFLSAIRVVSSAYLRLLIFILAIFIPTCDSSSRAFCMMYYRS